MNATNILLAGILIVGGFVAFQMNSSNAATERYRSMSKEDLKYYGQDSQSRAINEAIDRSGCCN